MDDSLVRESSWRKGRSNRTVLILVVVDDSLVPIPANVMTGQPAVLILVVVDDSLVLGTPPSFNGRCRVLILVVVDDSLVLEGVRTINCNRILVLILVVVDDSLVRATVQLNAQDFTSLNPCCSGR